MWRQTQAISPTQKQEDQKLLMASIEKNIRSGCIDAEYFGVVDNMGTGRILLVHATKLPGFYRVDREVGSLDDPASSLVYSLLTSCPAIRLTQMKVHTSKADV
jgi:hypothetical protein